MEAKAILVGNWCFVCGDELGSTTSRSIQETTSCSDKQLIKFIETFTDIEFGEHLIIESPQTQVCLTCIERIEEYDKICQRAAEIHEEISNLFSQNQTRRYDELNCDICHTQFLSQEEMSMHECIDESVQIEYDEYDEAEPLEDTEISEAKPVEVALKASKLDTINYTCNTCGEQFARKRFYLKHIKLAHIPESAETFNCIECASEKFLSKPELDLHMVIAHPADPNCKLFQCPVCSKSFKNKQFLNRHFGIHAKNRPHFCEICGKSFYHYSSFYAHGKLHANIRDFICQCCFKAFRSQSHLNRHLKSHTKTKNHRCTVCDARFAERYNLTVHLNAHFGINRKKRQPE